MLLQSYRRVSKALYNRIIAWGQTNNENHTMKNEFHIEGYWELPENPENKTAGVSPLKDKKPVNPIYRAEESFAMDKVITPGSDQDVIIKRIESLSYQISTLAKQRQETISMPQYGVKLTISNPSGDLRDDDINKTVNIYSIDSYTKNTFTLNRIDQHAVKLYIFSTNSINIGLLMNIIMQNQFSYSELVIL